MRVTVRLFAGLREHAGTGRRDVDLGDGARVEDVWPALELGDEPAGLVFAVNRAYVGRGQALAEGDEVALIPPVSGGAFRLTEDPIDLAAVVGRGRGRARRRNGHVRRHRARPVAGPAGRAARVRGLRRHGRERHGRSRRAAEERYDLCAIAITHRVGVCEIGDASVAIAVSAPHRQDALAACKDAIDTLKETVPLWKKEVYEGGEEWIGRGS